MVRPRKSATADCRCALAYVDNATDEIPGTAPPTAPEEPAPAEIVAPAVAPPEATTPEPPAPPAHIPLITGHAEADAYQAASEMANGIYENYLSKGMEIKEAYNAGNKALDKYAEELKGKISTDPNIGAALTKWSVVNRKSDLYRLALRKAGAENIVPILDDATTSFMDDKQEWDTMTFHNTTFVRDKAANWKAFAAVPGMKTAAEDTAGILRAGYADSVLWHLPMNLEKDLGALIPKDNETVKKELTTAAGTMVTKRRQFQELFAIVTDPDWDPSIWAPWIRDWRAKLQDILSQQKDWDVILNKKPEELAFPSAPEPLKPLETPKAIAPGTNIQVSPSPDRAGRALLMDAVNSWIGDPADMRIHMDAILHPEGATPYADLSGSGKQLRDQAAALIKAVYTGNTNDVVLYRGSETLLDTTFPASYTPNEKVALKFGGGEQSNVFDFQPGTLKGIKASDIVGPGGVDQAEQQWIAVDSSEILPDAVQRSLGLTPPPPPLPAPGPTSYIAQIGVTPFRAAKDQAYDFYTSDRYTQFVNDIRDTASYYKVNVESTQQATGMWEGATEPSASIKAYDGEVAVKAFAADLGRAYDQEGVLIFRPDPNGQSVEATFAPSKSNWAEELQKVGISGSTQLADGGLQIVGSGPDFVAQLDQLAANVGQKYKTQTGDFILQERDNGDYAAAIRAYTGAPPPPEGVLTAPNVAEMKRPPTPPAALKPVKDVLVVNDGTGQEMSADQIISLEHKLKDANRYQITDVLNMGKYGNDVVVASTDTAGKITGALSATTVDGGLVIGNGDAMNYTGFKKMIMQLAERADADGQDLIAYKFGQDKAQIGEWLDKLGFEDRAMFNRKILVRGTDAFKKLAGEPIPTTYPLFPKEITTLSASQTTMLGKRFEVNIEQAKAEAWPYSLGSKIPVSSLKVDDYFQYIDSPGPKSLVFRVTKIGDDGRVTYRAATPEARPGIAPLPSSLTVIRVVPTTTPALPFDQSAADQITKTLKGSTWAQAVAEIGYDGIPTAAMLYEDAAFEGILIDYLGAIGDNADAAMDRMIAGAARLAASKGLSVVRYNWDGSTTTDFIVKAMVRNGARADRTGTGYIISQDRFDKLVNSGLYGPRPVADVDGYKTEEAKAEAWLADGLSSLGTVSNTLTDYGNAATAKDMIMRDLDKRLASNPDWQQAIQTPTFIKPEDLVEGQHVSFLGEPAAVYKFIGKNTSYRPWRFELVQAKTPYAGTIGDRINFSDAELTSTGHSPISAVTQPLPRDSQFGTTESEKIMSSMIETWAGTSADTDVISLALQHAAVDEFGLSAQALDIFGRRDQKYVQWAEDFYRSQAPALRAFLRAMYDSTQERFKAAGIDHVTIYRGIQDNEIQADRVGIAEYEQQPMSSFSTSYDVARRFSGTPGEVVAVNVPVTRIVGTSRTGFGSLSEREMVVLGRTENAAREEVAAAQFWSSANNPQTVDKFWTEVQKGVEALQPNEEWGWKLDGAPVPGDNLKVGQYIQKSADAGPKGAVYQVVDGPNKDGLVTLKNLQQEWIPGTWGSDYKPVSEILPSADLKKDDYFQVEGDTGNASYVYVFEGFDPNGAIIYHTAGVPKLPEAGYKKTTSTMSSSVKVIKMEPKGGGDMMYGSDYVQPLVKLTEPKEAGYHAGTVFDTNGQPWKWLPTGEPDAEVYGKVKIGDVVQPDDALGPSHPIYKVVEYNGDPENGDFLMAEIHPDGTVAADTTDLYSNHHVQKYIVNESVTTGDATGWGYEVDGFPGVVKDIVSKLQPGQLFQYTNDMGKDGPIYKVTGISDGKPIYTTLVNSDSFGTHPLSQTEEVQPIKAAKGAEKVWPWVPLPTNTAPKTLYDLMNLTPTMAKTIQDKYVLQMPEDSGYGKPVYKLDHENPIGSWVAVNPEDPADKITIDLSDKPILLEKGAPTTPTTDEPGLLGNIIHKLSDESGFVNVSAFFTAGNPISDLAGNIPDWLGKLHFQPKGAVGPSHPVYHFVGATPDQKFLYAKTPTLPDETFEMTPDEKIFLIQSMSDSVVQTIENLGEGVLEIGKQAEGYETDKNSQSQGAVA
jgi:hypothetical protein